MEDFEDKYWNEIWGWYENGGIAHVAAYLTELNISTFDAKALPPKTEAFWALKRAWTPAVGGRPYGCDPPK